MNELRHRSLPRLDAGPSPSAWSHRAPAIALALIGATVAAYLALYQAGATASVWEPLFGAGSERILRSEVATLLPVPDAALGLVAYLVEAVLLAIGDEERWHDRPRLVLAMGALVAAMAMGAVALVLVQVVGFGTGCTLCLASAAISLSLAGLAAPEIAASLAVVRSGQDTERMGRRTARH